MVALPVCLSHDLTPKPMSMKFLQNKLAPWGYEGFILGLLPLLPNCESHLLAPELCDGQQ